MIYLSNRKFKLWSYSISHCSLLLRSPMQFLDEDEYSSKNDHNIDMEFWGVEYLNIPTKIDSLSIDEEKSIPISLNLDRNKLSKQGKVYIINGLYYIIAGGLLIGKNTWIDQDRIFNFNMELEHKEVIYSS